MTRSSKPRLLMAIGNSYRGLGLSVEAVEVLEKSRRLYEEQLGSDAPNTLTSDEQTSPWPCGHAGKLDQALPLLKRR